MPLNDKTDHLRRVDAFGRLREFGNSGTKVAKDCILLSDMEFTWKVFFAFATNAAVLPTIVFGSTNV
jgi:hypothetical protein